MASVSNLLKSAETARKRQAEYEEQVMAYNWELSAKTLGDLQVYAKFLRDQQKKVSDPSQALGYEKKIRSARKSYVSNEIQRQTIGVLEGRSSNTQKLDVMTSLYFQAIDNNDYDLAQNLRQQIDSLDLRIQSEAESAQRLAGQMAALNAKSINDAIKIIKDDMNYLDQALSEKGIKTFSEEVTGYAKELGTDPDFFDIKYRLAQEIDAIYGEAIQSDPANADKWTKERQEFKTQDQLSLPTASGTMKISFQDLEDHIDATRTGQELFRTSTVGGKTVFERNKETGFVWGRRADGSYRMVSLLKPDVSKESGVFKTRVSGDKVEYLGENDQVVAIKDRNGEIRGIGGKSIEDAQKRSYEDLLRGSGFNIIQTSDDGFITIANPTDEQGNLLIPGLQTDEVRLYVGPDGQLQILAQDNEAYNFEFDEITGQFKGIKKYDPSAITMVQDQFSQEFIQSLDKSRLPDGVIGIVDPDLANSKLLEVAEFTRKDIFDKEMIKRAAAEAAERQKRQAAQVLQPTVSPQLPAPRRLQAPRFNPQRTANPQETMRINGQGDLLGKRIKNVGVAKPSGNLRVTNSGGYSGTLRVR